GGATLELPVTSDWGPGAYVTAALYRPMDRAAKRMPGRALGLAWAGVDPGERRLQVALETAPVTRPRGTMQVRLHVPGLVPGEEAYATLAAVDLGILNLTGYKVPQPDVWYFGQRRLGIELRDLYGQLIDPMQGAPGVVRSGGDGGLARLQAPPPTEELMAWFSGVVRLDDRGGAALEVPVTSFNGTVRLMAMAWTAKGVGHGTADALVRDPVVLTIGMPRFLAPGDRSRLLLDLAQVEGEGGPTRVTVSADQGLVALDPTRAAQEVTLTPGARTAVLIPIEAMAVGDETLSVRIATAGGQTLTRALTRALTRPLTLGVRDNTPPVYVTEPHPLSPGGEPLTLTAERLADMVPGTGSLLVSVSRAGRLDLAGLLRTLDRYPHGCTEQLVSRALPLLYLDQVALAAGLSGDPPVEPRLQEAITRVLANQSADGRFGAWGPGGDDPWLDSFATDFLTRARERGYPVPDAAFDAALTNLQNRAAYTSPGESDAYALYVLARNGRASIGDLRYLADERLSDLGSPMAKAQVGAALALYGDPARADAALDAAVRDLAAPGKTGWRSD
ncbi:MAG: alpha-2-macroglobulin, partial [Chromatiaceae bacterium]